MRGPVVRGYVACAYLNPRGAGVTSRTRAAGGGKYYPPLLTKKQTAVEIHGRWQLKARNEKVQMSVFKIGQI